MSELEKVVTDLEQRVEEWDKTVQKHSARIESLVGVPELNEITRQLAEFKAGLDRQYETIAEIKGTIASNQANVAEYVETPNTLAGGTASCTAAVNDLRSHLDIAIGAIREEFNQSAVELRSEVAKCLERLETLEKSPPSPKQPPKPRTSSGGKRQTIPSQEPPPKGNIFSRAVQPMRRLLGKGKKSK